ncbi:MAG: class I SAM-dependent RNA methyltransferase [Verrucomicrobiota bacterium]
MKRRPPKSFRPEPFSYHQELEATIESLTNLAQGVARIDGWVVFVPFALPGERVRLRIFRNHKNHSEADLLEVLDPSPDRIDPRCPLFGTCGGCNYQHLAYETQLRWKRRQVEELLRHMVGLEFPVEPPVPSPQPYGYRSKLTPHFAKPRESRIGPIGFLRAGTRHQIVDVAHCHIAVPAINQALPSLRAHTRQQETKRRKGATLLLRAADKGVENDPNQEIEETVDGLRFRFLAGDFFQNNPFILPAFTRYAAQEAKTGGATHLIDAFCGSGLFAIACARHFESVLGIEISETAVERAQANALRNGLAHCRFQAGDAAAIFAQVGTPPERTTILIDPPRKGSTPEFLVQLFAYGPSRVVYVSCNPATQMRDLKLFLENGYHLQRVQPFDLFPQTKHLECVMTLTKEGSPEEASCHGGHGGHGGERPTE